MQKKKNIYYVSPTKSKERHIFIVTDLLYNRNDFLTSN